MQRLRSRWDKLRGSLFFLPAVAIVVAYGAARAMAGWRGPAWVGESTIDSARAVLSVVAGATITFASIAFSVSLLVMQQGSSQFTPRVLPALTRDPFNRRVIALVMGTFTFALVTLQRVRGAIGGEGSADVPDAAVALAVVLGIAAVLAVVGAINHTARMMHVSSILDRIVRESRRAQAVSTRSGLTAERVDPDADAARRGAESTEVVFEADGWVRGVDVDELIEGLPAGTRLVLDTYPGRYAVAGAPLGFLSPRIPPEQADEVQSRVTSALDIGRTRTISQDPSLPVRQLVDVALKALSPGVNDPTTALDAIFHLGTVLADHVRGEPVANRFSDDDGTEVVFRHPVTDEDVAELAMGELRVAAVAQPAVVIYLFEMVEAVAGAARSEGRPERAEPFIAQARLLRDVAVRSDVPEYDRGRIAAGFARRFDSDEMTLAALKADAEAGP